MKSLVTTISQSISKLLRALLLKLVVVTGRIRMHVAVKAARTMHAHSAKQYALCDINNKRIKQYIVLLDKVEFVKSKEKGKQRAVRQERLFYINRHNFKSIKRRGWLPKNMDLGQLRYNCFYHSDMVREYSDDVAMIDDAQARYKAHLLKKYTK